jgi:hypothetical protein
MAFLGALERGYRAWSNLQAIPEQQRTERQLALAQRLGQLGRDIERETADAADQRTRSQALLTEQLAPRVAAREEAAKGNEAQRASDAYRNTVDGTIAVTRATGDVRGGLMDRQTDGNIRTIGAEYDGRANLAEVIGGVNLKTLDSQQRAALGALDRVQNQEQLITGMFLGNQPLVPEVLKHITDSENRAYAHSEKMSKPTAHDWLAGVIVPTSLAFASALAK